MAEITEVKEDNHNNPMASSKKTFSAALDAADPLGFLEKVFEFVSKESDPFKSEDVDAIVKMVKNKMVKRVPNKDNGLDMDKYCWGQSFEEVKISIPVPTGTKKRFVTCEIKENHLKVGLKDQPPVLDGELFQPVNVDDCFWTLDDRKSISILLAKENKMKWWQYLVKGEPEIDIPKAKLEKTDLAGLNHGMHSAVASMMFDQSEKQGILNKFHAEHPETNFSRAKIK